MATTTQYLPSEMAAAIDAIPVFSNISSEDNGMVVVNGHLQDQTSRTIVANGTYDTTTNDEVQVNVSGSGSVTLAEKSVTENGTYLPSGDSADGYSKVTVNVPTVSAADNGKAVSGGRLVEQTTKSISANGTYNTTLNNSVIVNVPNSGSGSSVVTYDVPDFIENSDKSKVLLDLYADDYDETNQSWGNMVLMTSTNSFFKDYYGVLKLDSQGLEVGGRYGYRFNLQNTSKVTIYAIAKRRQFISHSGEALVNADYFVADIASSHTSSYPLYAAALSYNGPFVESPIGKFNVYTLTVDIENLSASLYANGAFISSKQLDSTDRLRHIRFGEDADVQYLYVGAVAGIEDTQTIFANHHVAMTFIQDARMILPDDDMPSPMFLSNSEPDDILVNADYRDFSSSDNTFGPFTSHGGVLTDDCEGVLVSGGVALTYALPTSVNGLTVYAVIKKVFDWDKVSGAYTEANSILFQIGNTSGDSDGVYLHGRTGRTGTYPETSYQVFDLSPVEEFGVYAISVNYRTRKANFYFEGSLKATVDISDIPYDVLTIGGRYVSGELSAESQVQLLFAGVVSGVEDSTVIAQNSIELREFMNDSRIALGTEVKSIVSKTITENGTYNPVDDDAYAYSQVTVNVSAGESSTLVEKTITANGTYDPEDDNADGYSEVNVNLPLLRRKSYIPYTDQTRILQELTWADYDTENHTFGAFTLFGSSYPTVDANGLLLGENTYLAYDLVNVKRDITVYVVCKRHSSLSGDRYIFGCPVTGTFGEVEEEAVPAFTVDGADVNCVTTLINHVYNYRSDSPIYSGDDYIVLSMQIRRGESSSVAYFSHGRRSWQGEFRHDAHLRYFYLGGDGKTTSGGTTTNSDYYFLYVAIVDGIDDITGQSSYGAGTLNEDFLYNSINELKTAPHMSLTTKTITANGTFDALNDNADGYSRVTVNVPDSSGTSFNIPDFIASSDKSKVLLDLYPDDFDDLTCEWGSLSDSTIRGNNDTPYYYYGRVTKSAYGLEVPNDMCLSGQVDVTSATFYCVFSVRAQRGINNVFYLELLETQDILFPGSHYESECIGLTNNFQSVYAYPSSDSSLLYSDRPFSVNEGDYNVFTISVDVPNGQAKYYCNGALVYTVSFTPRSDSVSSIPVKISNAGACYLYLGAVDGVEDQQTILANHSAIMAFLGSARVRHPIIPFQSSYFSRNSYYRFVRVCAATDNIGGSGWTALDTNTGGSLSFDCTGVKIDENTALTCDVSVKSSSTPSESVAYSSGFTVYAICKQVKLSKDDTYAVMLQVANTEDDSSNISLSSFDTNSGPSYDHTSHLDDMYYTDTTSIFFGPSVDSTTHVDSFYNATKMGYSIYAISVSYGNTANWRQPKACFYIDGYKQAELELDEATYDRVVFGGSYNSSTLDTSHDFRFLYIAIVSCPESGGLIYRNCCDMRSYLKDARISLPLS